jgi:hypothetical protein
MENNLDELIETFEVASSCIVDYVWSRPDLRKELIAKARRAIVLSAYGKLGNESRNARGRCLWCGCTQSDLDTVAEQVELAETPESSN